MDVSRARYPRLRIIPTESMYRVLPNAVPDLTDTDLITMRRIAQAKGGRIFNPDALRVQAPLPRNAPIVRKMRRALKGVLYGRVASGSVVLHSSPGCRQQQWHTDYDPALLRRCRRKPLGAVLALQDGTAFMVRADDGRQRRLQLSRGDVLVFDGDLVHAGAAYAKHNTRVHMYVDSPTTPSVHNQTWLHHD